MPSNKRPSIQVTNEIRDLLFDAVNSKTPKSSTEQLKLDRAVNAMSKGWKLFPDEVIAAFTVKIRSLEQLKSANNNVKSRPLYGQDIVHCFGWDHRGTWHEGSKAKIVNIYGDRSGMIQVEFPEDVPFKNATFHMNQLKHESEVSVEVVQYVY